MRNKVFITKDSVNIELMDNQKNIYILSTSTHSKHIFFTLLQNHVKIAGFCTNRIYEGRKILYGLTIYSLEEIKEENAVYISDESEWNSDEWNVDFKKVFFIDALLYNNNEFVFWENGERRKCNAALALTMLLSRAQKKKVYFLLNSENSDFWLNLADVLKNEIGEVSIIAIDTECEKIYNMMYSDLDEIIIFIAVFECREISELLIELGLKPTYHFVYIYNSFSGHITDKYYGFDWYLGNTFITEKEFPGYYIHGNRDGKKIVLLGNSTSDPLFYPQKSWPEMLWEYYKEKGLDITIFNGAITDYSSTNEVIKLYRDVLLLKPDIVISYSGIIDFRQYIPGYPYLNLNLVRTSEQWEEKSKKEVIYGIKDKRSSYERWITNEKIMYQICSINGINFYGVLQPWIGSGDQNVCEKLQIWSDYYWQIAFPQFDDYVNNAKIFKECIQKDIRENDWLYDFTDIFRNICDEDIYFDSIHVNEQGNRIVAERFSKLIEV